MASIRVGSERLATGSGRRGFLASVILAIAGLPTRAGERAALATQVTGDSSTSKRGVRADNSSTNIALAAVNGQPCQPSLTGPSRRCTPSITTTTRRYAAVRSPYVRMLKRTRMRLRSTAARDGGAEPLNLCKVR